MGRHNADHGVFIRSMAARNSLGGLAAAAGDALVVLGAMDFGRIVVETVGVGQNEIDILHHASTIIIVQSPASGDAVQALKAGMLEIGDIFVINKSDTPGADRIVAALRESLEIGRRAGTPENWLPPVLKTQAADGLGTGAVADAIASHARYFEAHPEQEAERRRAQAKGVLAQLLADILREVYRENRRHAVHFERAVEDILARRCAPYTAAFRLLHERGFI
jgi:LAO/AO transport system kinase